MQNLTHPRGAAGRPRSKAHPGWQHLFHRDESAFDDPAFDPAFRTRLREAAARVRKYRTPHHPLALVSDLLRLAILYIHGGIYLDLDMEVLKPLDGFRGEDLILPQFQAGVGVGIGEFLLGAPARSPAIALILDRLMGMRPLPSNVGLITPSVYHGLVAEHGWRVWPSEYFCPLDRDGVGAITENTHAIHRWQRRSGRGGDRKSTWGA